MCVCIREEYENNIRSNNAQVIWQIIAFIRYPLIMRIMNKYSHKTLFLDPHFAFNKVCRNIVERLRMFYVIKLSLRMYSVVTYLGDIKLAFRLD